jgi:hypothetical protein
VLGAQRPRLSNLPARVASLGDQATSFASSLGIELDDWQQWVLCEALGEKPDGKWSALTVGLCVGRQNGKNEVLLVRELFGLLVLGERGILHTAHLHKAVSTQFRRIKAVFESTPELKSRLRAANSSVGQQFIELTTGQRIEFATRQGSKTGRSLTLDLIVHDESMYISDTSMGAVMPTMAAQSLHGNIQTWFTGSAPDADEPDHDGVPFARIRDTALKGSENIFWAEWSVECEDRDRVPAEWLVDPVKIGEANPSLGIRMSVPWAIAESQQLSRRDYLRERFGITAWPDPSDEAGRVISREQWDALACQDESQRIIGPRTFALDANVDNTRGSIAVAGRRPDGATHVTIVEHRPFATWMVDRCGELSREIPGSEFVLDVRGPLAHLKDALEDAGLRLVEIDMAEYAEACVGFVGGVEKARIRYPFPQPELSEAIADARKQPMGDRWKWSRRKSSSGDVSPLVAASLAVWGAQVSRVPEVHDLGAIIARKERELAEQQPDRSADPPGFIRLEDLPAGFRS